MLAPMAELPALAAAVLDAVDLVPPGRVVTYGDVGAFVGCGPRQVGRAMALWGGAVGGGRGPRADGSPPAGDEPEALQRCRAEWAPLRAGGSRVDLPAARWALPR